MNKSRWRIDLKENTAYGGQLYIVRKCYRESDGVEMGTEKKLINVEEIPYYIRGKG